MGISKTILLLALSFLMGCQEYSSVQLRIENVSQVDFDEVSVNNVSFGPLKANEVSEYISFENIYESEFIEVTVAGEKLRVLPEEYNSDKYYNEGNYKFVIDIVQKKWLSVQFEIQ